MIKILRITDKPISYIGEVAGICYGSNTTDQEKNYKRGINCLNDNHGRTFEYPDVTMVIDGYSARVIRELYTHTIGTSRLQQSTRYVNCSDFDYYTPDNLGSLPKIDYEDCMDRIKLAYQELLNIGVSKEDAANVLPLGMHTQVVLKINLRALLHMFEIRTCARAYKEFRELMEEIRDVLSRCDGEWKELMGKYALVKCDKSGYCDESMGCGRYSNKE